MSNIKFIVPEATTNLVTNPSIDIDTTGYTAVGGATALARVTTQQQFGPSGLSVTPDTGVNDGVYYAITLVAATQYTFSVYVKGVNAIPYQIYVYDVTGTVTLGTTTFTGTGLWTRQTVIVTTGANTSHRLYIEKNNSADVAAFFLDAMQVEAKGYVTTYCDGDQEGCSWASTKHASTSTRDSQSRAGGKVVDPDDFNVRIQTFSGLGMPPLIHNTKSFAQAPGAEVQSEKVNPRVMTMAYYTDSPTKAAMYTARKDFENVVKSDLVATLQPVGVRYTGVTEEIEIGAYYDSGLEGDYQHLGYDVGASRLISYSPFWQSVVETSTDLNTGLISTMRYVAGRESGIWNNLGPPAAAGSGGAVTAMAVGPDNAIYVGGIFTDWDGDTSADYIAKRDPITGNWANIGAADNFVYDIKIAPDGTVYACGSFANIGGTAAARIASWDGATWSALGTGITTGAALNILIENGRVYVTGTFTAPGARIAYWDIVGASWNTLGNGIDNNGGYKMAVLSDSRIAVGGDFTAVNSGTDANGIAIVDPSDSSWTGSSEIDPGATAEVYAIKLMANGVLYLGGDNFDSLADKVIGTWTGGSVTMLSDQPDDIVFDIAQIAAGDIYIGGQFENSGNGVVINNIAKLISGTLAAVDATFPAGTTPNGVFWNGLAVNGNDIYVGFVDDAASPAGLTGTMFAGQSNVVTNNGQTKAYPRFVFKRTGGTAATLTTIRNNTTGVELLFDLDIADGETITIDLSQPTRKSVTSDFSGSRVSDYFPPGLSTFSFVPGDNEIIVEITKTGSPTMTAYAIWKNQYWSIDGAQ